MREYRDTHPPGMDAWQESVMAGFKRLDEAHVDLNKRIDSLVASNDAQHNQLAAQVSEIAGDVKGLQSGLLMALDAANDKIASKNKAIRSLEIVIVFLVAMIVESKVHLIELIKAMAG